MDSSAAKKKLDPILLRAVIVFIIVLLLTIVSITASYMYMDEVEQEMMSSNRDMRIWQSRINDSVENNQIIEEFESNFIKLVNQGVVGEEERLSWFESLQNTAKKRGMPLVKYSISSQLLLKEKNLKRDYPAIDVFKSTMTLNMKMGHEGDLFALLNNLENSHGLFAVDKCDIAKINRKNTDSINNMKAYCELGWYTFKAKNKQRGR